MRDSDPGRPPDPLAKAPPPGPREPGAAGSKPGPSIQKRDLIYRLVGRKVSVSTTDMHHVVGRLDEIVLIDGDDTLRILVDNQEVHVRRLGVARIHEADPALAEYVK